MEMETLNAKDLRIGNLISLSGERILKVCLIECDSISVFRGVDDKGETFKNTWADLLPIPLSEDWLLRFGFKKTETYVGDNELYSIGHGFFQIYEVGGTEIENNQEIREYAALFTPELPAVHSFIKFNYYIHELQNLYFALTGSELTITKQ